MGRDDTYDVDMPVIMTIFGHFRPGKSVDTSQLANRPSSLHRHEDECESVNEHLGGTLDPVTDQNVNRGDVRSKLKKHDCHNAPLFQGGYHHQND